MNIELNQIFSIPIFRSRYFLEDSAHNHLLDTIKRIENTDKKTDFYLEGSFTDYGINQKPIMEYDYLSDFKKFLTDTVQTIHQNMGLMGEVELCESWFTVTRKNGYHELHNHGTSVWSGVYYVNANHYDAPITFVNKNHFDSAWPANTKKKYLNDFNSNEKICSVETGMLLIFPSFLFHKVERQDQDTDRITIAFNFNSKKEN